jgi:hypothetical protein
VHGVDACDAGQLHERRRVLEPRSQQFLHPLQPERRVAYSFADRVPCSVGNQLQRQTVDGQGRDAVRRPEFLVEPGGESDRRSATEFRRLVQNRRMFADILHPARAAFDMETASASASPVVRMGLRRRVEHQV